MKKGFTLVEIIISISLILIVGVSTTFFIFNNKNNRKLEKVTKEVLLAANLYVNKEVDDNGNIYINAIKSGKKGVKIPLTNLVNKGYIDESLQKEVIDLSNKGNDYNYYVMLLDGNEEGLDYCDGDTFSLASWIDPDKDKDIYLCNGSQVGQEDNNHNGNLGKYLVSTNLGKLELTDSDEFSVRNYETLKKYPSNYGFVYYSDNFVISDLDGEQITVGCLNNGLYNSDLINWYYAYEDVKTFSFRGIVHNYIKLNDVILPIIHVVEYDNNSQYEIIVAGYNSQITNLENSDFYTLDYSFSMEEEELRFAGYLGNYESEGLDIKYLSYLEEPPIKIYKVIQKDNTKFKGSGTTNNPYQIVYK